MVTLLGGHHKLTHDGLIAMSGDGDGVLVFTRNGVEIRGEDVRMLSGRTLNDSPSVDQSPVPNRAPIPQASNDNGTSRGRQLERNALAKTALRDAGYKPSIAVRAVERAVCRVPDDAPLEALLKEALRHCN